MSRPAAPGGASAIEDLLELMATLRSPQGCPWDRAQSFASIAPYTVEEAYEVADAIERGDLDDLRDELGDLLFQVVFHARLAEEAGRFDFDSVARAIVDKLRRRHPHVFAPVGEAARAAAAPSWEELKARERAGKRPADGALDGVARGLPSLARANKLSVRAARVGFDFEHAEQTADKVAEELAEVREAARDLEAAGAGADAGVRAALFEEVGDLLFAAANLARKLKVDPEAALAAANGKFERRFRAMEDLARARGAEFERLNLADQEALWQEVKRRE